MGFFLATLSDLGCSYADLVHENERFLSFLCYVPNHSSQLGYVWPVKCQVTIFSAPVKEEDTFCGSNHPFHSFFWNIL